MVVAEQERETGECTSGKVILQALAWLRSRGKAVFLPLASGANFPCYSSALIITLGAICHT